jgi:hypothetical protein
MAGTIVVDRLESDASYASSINVASPIQFSNTITGNVNIDSGLIFVDAVNNRVGVGGNTNPSAALDITGGIFVRGSTNPGGPTNRVVIDYNGQDGLATISANSTGGGTQMAFGTSNSGTNATRMLIDSLGRVTTPFQPSFNAIRTTSSPHANVVVYSTADTNIGSHYSTSTGRFTAPVSGTYYFYATGLSGTNVGISRLQIRVNGTGRSGQWRMPLVLLTGAGDRYMWGSLHLVYFLNANDFVDVYYSNDDLVSALYGDTTPYSTFGGFLIG